MKIVTAEEMQAADAAATAELGINARVLMESAGRECAAVVLRRYSDAAKRGVIVAAGPGNNGGDGFVVARSLRAAGCKVKVVCTEAPERLKVDPRANADTWLRLGGEVTIFPQADKARLTTELCEAGVVVDALFGTGFSGEPRGEAREFIGLIQQARSGGTVVLALDVPSGLDASSALAAECRIEADCTVALQTLKIGHVLFPGTACCGDIFVADIGIPAEIGPLRAVRRTLLTPGCVSALLHAGFRPNPQSHKGTRGHVLIVGGSAGHLGAPKMSARAALEAGAGLATMLLPERAAQEIQSQLVETMCMGAPEDSQGGFGETGRDFVEEIVSNKDCVVLGPGLGQGAGAKLLVEHVLTLSATHHYPLVIDADAVNLIGAHPELKRLIPPHAVLTPHPGEMARLMGVSVKQVQSDRLGIASAGSAELGCWLVLKGARSVIAGPSGEIFVNPTACEALATGGSGDVLAGIVGAFAGRGMAVGDAACGGVFVHGLAGESASADEGGNVGVVASDLIERAPKVINSLLAVPASDIFFPGSAALVLPAAA